MVFRTNPLNFRHFSADILTVFMSQPDGPAPAITFVRYTGLAGPYNGNPFSHAMHVFAHRFSDTDTKSQKQDDCLCAPDQAKHRHSCSAFVLLEIGEDLQNIFIESFHVMISTGCSGDFMQLFFENFLTLFQTFQNFDGDGITQSGLHRDLL